MAQYWLLFPWTNISATLTLNPLNTTYVVFNPYNYPIKSQLLGTKWVCKHQALQILFQIKYIISHFQPRQVVSRRSETQIQVVENLNY